MNKKYFDTRKDSLEDKINTIASEQPSISKPQTDVKLSVEKKYFETKKGSLEDLASKLVEEKALSTKGATRKPTSASDRLYLSNPNEHRRRQELEFTYKRILASMPEKERNSKEGKIQAMDLARVRSAKNEKDLAKNMKHKGTLKIAENPLMALGRTAAAAAGTAAGTAVGNKIGDKITSQKKYNKEDKDPCWKDYEMIGTKKKNGKEVPNCVPKSESADEKKPFEQLRQETKLVRLGKNGKTDTGEKAAVIDLEPSAKPI